MTKERGSVPLMPLMLLIGAIALEFGIPAALAQHTIVEGAGGPVAGAQGQLGAPTGSRPRAVPRQAVRAFEIDRLLGVNPDFWQGNWSRISGSGGMIEQARFVGAETLRIGAPDPANWATPLIPELVEAGVKLDLVTLPSAMPQQNATWIKEFLVRYPGSVAMVEGPNEPNNWGVNYASKSGVEGAVAWQRDFYAMMKADPVTADLPIYGMSSFPVVA